VNKGRCRYGHGSVTSVKGKLHQRSFKIRYFHDGAERSYQGISNIVGKAPQGKQTSDDYKRDQVFFFNYFWFRHSLFGCKLKSLNPHSVGRNSVSLQKGIFTSEIIRLSYRLFGALNFHTVTPFFKMILPYFAVSPVITIANAFLARS